MSAPDRPPSLPHTPPPPLSVRRPSSEVPDDQTYLVELIIELTVKESSEPAPVESEATERDKTDYGTTLRLSSSDEGQSGS